MKTLFALASVFVMACPSDAQVGPPTISVPSNRMDEWMNDALHHLSDFMGLQGLSVTMCLDGKVARVSIFVSIGPPLRIAPFKQVTSEDCDPNVSVYVNGDPLNSTGAADLARLVLSPPTALTQNNKAPARLASLPPMPGAPPFRNIFFPPVQDVRPPAAAPDCDPTIGGRVYRVNHSQKSVSFSPACSGVKTNIPVTSNPLELAFTPDGSQLLVTSFDNAITFINTTNNTVSAVLKTDYNVNPSGIAISPDGSTAYVTSFNNDNPGLLVVDIKKRAVVQSIFTTAYPQSVFLSPDGMLAWVTFPFSNTLYIIDTLTKTVTRTLAVNAPFCVRFNGTGTLAYITNGTIPGTVQVMDTATYKTVKTIPVGDQPVDLLIAPDDAFIVVGNYRGNSLTYIDPQSYATTQIPMGGRPRGLVLVQ